MKIVENVSIEVLFKMYHVVWKLLLRGSMFVVKYLFKMYHVVWKCIRGGARFNSSKNV